MAHTPRRERTYSLGRAWLHLHRALDEEANDLSRPLDRARSRTVLLAALGAVPAALLGAGAARLAHAASVGLLTAVAVAALVAVALVARLRALDRRAELAWQSAWARLEPVWSRREALPDRPDRPGDGPSF